MGYIGNTNSVQNFTPAVDYFNGNGSTTSFTLSRSVGSVFDVQAFIENVPQNPSTAFTVAGNVITFTSAPPSGTNNIYVRYTSPVTQLVKPAPGTVGPTELAGGPAAVSDQLNSSTGYFDLPTGTTAERPGTPVVGMTRYNTTLNYVEVYNGNAWVAVGDQGSLYFIESLVVAGGGGGGYSGAGGGGAGGYRSSVIGESSGGGANAENQLPLILGTSYTVTVGAGGAGATNGSSTGTNGSSSVFSIITSIGGGGGGSRDSAQTGGSGGSGGGGTRSGGSGGSGTSGQGYAGGASGSSAPPGAGGGGAGAVGSNASGGTSGTTGNGGVGVQSSINGTATFRAGGGGGGAGDGSRATAGGNGGGGAGGNSTSTASVAGTVNTGGGGGGGSNETIYANGAAGGSGIVIIRYYGPQRGTGGTVTSSGGYTIHTFTSSGTYTA
jgi:hypothetical protein